MTTALSIVVDAFERCNRLSPGETLSADDSALGFRRLNALADELRGWGTFEFSLPDFVDLTTNVTLPDGWKSALGAALAVRIAPSIIATIPGPLLRAEASLIGRLPRVEAAIVDVYSFTGRRYASTTLLG
jgi:hypothetical protein